MSSTCTHAGIRLLALIPFLSLMGGCPPPPNNTGVTPPTPVTDKGPVVYLTADKTSLSVGQTTTVRIWTQQTSPTAANDNGIFAVAVDIDAATAGIIESQVPVTFVSPWDQSVGPKMTGTASASGGITGIAATQSALPPDKSLGIAEPIQVATFQVTAKAAGTVTLSAKNHNGDGYAGVNPVGTGANGDEANYVPVTIAVQ
jgi:hypothetical protein